MPSRILEHKDNTQETNQNNLVSKGGKAKRRTKAANESFRDEAELWGNRKDLIRQEREARL